MHWKLQSRKSDPTYKRVNGKTFRIYLKKGNTYWRVYTVTSKLSTAEFLCRLKTEKFQNNYINGFMGMWNCCPLKNHYWPKWSIKWLKTTSERHSPPYFSFLAAIPTTPISCRLLSSLKKFGDVKKTHYWPRWSDILQWMVQLQNASITRQ